ncbi:MAG: DUF5615 family PIN-like protein [Acidimicrobiales bacterium]
MYPPGAARRLRDRGVDAVAVTESMALAGLDDEVILALAALDQRVLVTENISDFAVLGRTAEHVGIVFCHFRRFPRGADHIQRLVVGLARRGRQLPGQALIVDVQPHGRIPLRPLPSLPLHHIELPARIESRCYGEWTMSWVPIRRHDMRLAGVDLDTELPGGPTVRGEGHLYDVTGPLHAFHRRPSRNGRPASRSSTNRPTAVRNRFCSAGPSDCQS